MIHIKRIIPLAALSIFAQLQLSHADVIEYTSIEDWAPAAFPHATVNFTGFTNGTVLTNQYAILGIHFTDGNDVVISSPEAFPADGWGLRGGPSTFNSEIHVAFDAPQFAIGIAYPGGVQINLYESGRLVYSSSKFGGQGAGLFAGLVSSDSFDAIVINDWVDGNAVIDDLHWSSVPAPGGLLLFSIAMLRWSPRRRSK